MESFSNSSVSSSVPKPSLCCAGCPWAWCLFNQLLQKKKLSFPSWSSCGEQGRNLECLLLLSAPFLPVFWVSDVLIPATLLGPVASCWSPIVGPWAYDSTIYFPSLKRVLTSLICCWLLSCSLCPCGLEHENFSTVISMFCEEADITMFVQTACLTVDIAFEWPVRLERRGSL